MTRPGFTRLWEGTEAEGRLTGIRTLFVGPDADQECLIHASENYDHVFINPEVVAAWGLGPTIKVIEQLAAPATLCLNIDQVEEGIQWPKLASLMVSISTDAPVDQVRLMSGKSIKVASGFIEAEHDLYEEDRCLGT